MPKFTEEFLSSAVNEVIDSNETGRRARAKQRHDIYKYGGKNFLIEQLTRVFGADSIKEMRLTPINFLKKVVDKLGSIYKKPPQRLCSDAKDQALLDYYTKALNLSLIHI